VAQVRTLLEKLTKEKPSEEKLAEARSKVAELDVRIQVLAGEISRTANLPAETRDSVAKLAGQIETLKALLGRLVP
jgi:hypothetical protein